MNSFRFPLQALLDHKTGIEARLRGEVASCAKACAAAQSHLRRLTEKLNLCNSGSDLRLRALHAQYLDDAIREQMRLIEKCEASLTSAQGALRSAAIQKFALERLRERRWKAHVDAQERAEESELEESNLHRRAVQ